MSDDPRLGGAPAVPAQQPQAGIAAVAPSPAPTAQATPPAGEPTTETMSLEEAKKLRQEHNALRKRLAEYEAAQKAADEAKLDELGKLQKQHAELQGALTATQQRAVRAEIKAAATSAGIDPTLAAKLIGTGEVEFGDDGEPANLGKLLAALVKAYPYLASAGAGAQGDGAGAGQPTRAVSGGGAAAAGGATNPGRGSTVGQPITHEYLAKLASSPDGREEYARRRDEIRQFLATNVR